MKIWQYGSNEELDLKWEQDGVAPQCAIPGLDFNSTNPNKGRIRFGGDDSLLGFLSSHSGTSYRWVINLLDEEDLGYVKKRN